MKKEYYEIETDGFYGAYYENKTPSNKALILMLGDSIDDMMAKAGVKWSHDLGFNVMTMSPAKKDYGHHNYPLERFEKAIEVIKKKGNTKIAIAGASTTGMLALVAASFFNDITLTLAFTPCDFIMEGFYQDGLDNAKERPGDKESTVSYHGYALPYLPYAYRHPLYWQKLKEEAKEGKNILASRKMFDESEKLHPLQENEMIKIENIKGTIVLVGAEDDVLWDTCKYIRRMEDRLLKKSHSSIVYTLVYEHGTHFIFPETLLKKVLPIGSSLLCSFAFKAARDFKKECRETRKDIDQKIRMIIKTWSEENNEKN